MAAERQPRHNAGNRMSKLLNEEEEDDFYKNTYGGFNDEEDDIDFQSEDSESDEVDSDFSIDEDDEIRSDIDDDDEPKRKRGINTKAYKEPKKLKETAKIRPKLKKAERPSLQIYHSNSGKYCICCCMRWCQHIHFVKKFALQIQVHILKASSSSGITAEMLKISGKVGCGFITCIVNHVVHEGVIPNHWYSNIIVNCNKKASSTLCKVVGVRKGRNHVKTDNWGLGSSLAGQLLSNCPTHASMEKQMFNDDDYCCFLSVLISERKSLRQSTAEKSQATARREKEREVRVKMMKEIAAKRNVTEVRRLTQSELLEEAKLTEEYNIKSLETYQRLESEKKKCRVQKTTYKGALVRYQSVTMPLIEELPQSLHNNEPEINVEDVSGVDSISLKTETKGENDDPSKSPEKSKHSKQVSGPKCSRTFITFTDDKTFREYFPQTRAKPASASSRTLCPVTRQPAKYFDPITQTPYATTTAFKVLREALVIQQEQSVELKRKSRSSNQQNSSSSSSSSSSMAHNTTTLLASATS
ncbi:vacuolar protein sorting-associated protein 72 homolog [Octopus bimaculoides]|uniref:vacuolar protein sorting-associated protein 72 homolog n=1 Tax=Octopus bimaculoides TaxID=37653 RepID=UPI0022E34441|nr:vacuolar protein sorting-associated protein 72 homolog [Octopus bimaculoides]